MKSHEDYQDEMLAAQFVIDRENKLIQRAYDDVIVSAYKRYYRKQVQTGVYTNKALQKVVEKIGEDCFVQTRGRKKDTNMYFITISAKDGVDYYQFWSQMTKCIQKSSLKGSGMYVLEQRSEGEQDPYGFHIHWVVTFSSTTAKSVIVQQVYQCFSKYLAGPNYVDVRPLYEASECEAKRQYILGTKCELKMPKVLKDRIFRAKHNIPEYFSY